VFVRVGPIKNPAAFYRLWGHDGPKPALKLAAIYASRSDKSRINYAIYFSNDIDIRNCFSYAPRIPDEIFV
jgi:hypothetical protein